MCSCVGAWFICLMPSVALQVPVQLKGPLVNSVCSVCDCMCSAAHMRAEWCDLLWPLLLLTPGVPLPLRTLALCTLSVLCLPLKLVEVGEHSSRSHSINRASVEGSNDLRPGSDGFRPLDATVVEVGRGAC